MKPRCEICHAGHGREHSVELLFEYVPVGIPAQRAVGAPEHFCGILIAPEQTMGTHHYSCCVRVRFPPASRSVFCSFFSAPSPGSPLVMSRPVPGGGPWVCRAAITSGKVRKGCIIASAGASGGRSCMDSTRSHSRTFPTVRHGWLRGCGILQPYLPLCPEPQKSNSPSMRYSRPTEL